MNPRLAWYVARAAGLTAWGLLAAAVIWGLLLSTRVLRGRPTPRWLLDLHRFLGGLAVAFTGVHIAGLVADNYLHFGLADLLVPFASSWRPGAVALGVVGLWLLTAVEITSLLMRRMPRRWWHGIHLSSYALFWTATLHALLAGTDVASRAFVVAVDAAAVVVLALTIVRVIAPRQGRRGRNGTPTPTPPGTTHRTNRRVATAISAQPDPASGGRDSRGSAEDPVGRKWDLENARGRGGPMPPAHGRSVQRRSVQRRSVRASAGTTITG